MQHPPQDRGRRIAEQGRDPASVELETKTGELLSLAARRDRFEQFRDYTADLYFHHTKQVWAPRRGSHVSQTGKIATRVDGKEFARAKEAALDTREIPEGTLVAITGGKNWNDHDTVYRKHDEYLKRFPRHGAGAWRRPGRQPHRLHLGQEPRRQGRYRNRLPPRVEQVRQERSRHPRARRPHAERRRGINFETPGVRASRLYERAQTDRLSIETENVVDETARRQVAARRLAAGKQAAEARPAVAEVSPQTVRTPVYAGVGARATPPETLAAMTTMSDWLAKRGWHLHSGGAHGADTAFARGAEVSAKTVFVPWQGYNKQEGGEFVVPSSDILDRAREIAASLHPAWDKCEDSARLLHARNVAIVLGPNLDTPVDALMCWTEDGKTVGGTGMAIRIAEKFDIPVFNLATQYPRAVCEAMIDIEKKAAAIQHETGHTAAAGRQEEGQTRAAASVETPVHSSPAETVSAPEVDSSSRTLATRAESRHANPTYPGAGKAADTRYPEPAANTVPQLAEPDAAFSPTPDISQAFAAMVDAAVPDTEENETVRRTLFHRVVDAVHSTVAGPGGVEDQADRLHDRRGTLAREDYGSEIGVFQTLENEEKLENALSAQDLLHNARATLAAVAEEQTGERWSPAPAPNPGTAKSVTAASAEASEAIDRLKMDRDRARLPQQGTPIAIAAWNDNTDREIVHEVLNQTLKARPDMYIAHGNGHGTPELVAEWAQNNGIYQATFEPDRHRHGNQAAAERDRRLFHTVQPQIVIEFQGPKPTALAQEARKNNVTVWPVDDAKKEELRLAREAQVQARPTEQAMHQTLSTGKSAGMSM